MKFLKLTTRAILRVINPDLEYRLVEQHHFNQLGRRPPELLWKALPSNPEARLDAGRGQIGHELFVFGGFFYPGEVSTKLDIFDMEKEKWTARVDLPRMMAQTHLGVASDGERYIYLISGQLGRYCLPATANCFVFDTKTREFNQFLSLPVPRYAPAVQFCRGRLHVIAGAKEDRTTAADDHWSIAVQDGKAVENQWRKELPIPQGGHHRASAVVDDVIYVFGGQEGDYVAIPGDPLCRCTAELTKEIRFPNTYRFVPTENRWQRLADIPVLTSHTESSVIQYKEYVVIVGGDFDRQANKDILRVNDEIQLYNTRTNHWKTIGRLPYRLKAMCGGYYKGDLYITGGQRGKSLDDPTPLPRFEVGTWKAKLTLE